MEIEYPRVLIIIPAYNEQNNIKCVIDDLKRHCPNCDLVVVNDASTDDTENELKKLGVNHINLPLNLGIGGAVQTGYLYASSNDYDVAIQFDGDGQHSAQEVQKLLNEVAQGYDMVIGSRFIENEGFQSTGARRFGINILSWLILMVSKNSVKDVTSGFRAIDRKFINRFSIDYAQDYPEPESIVACSGLGGRIKEVATSMKERVSGESSITTLKSIYYMYKVSLAILFAAFMKEK